MKYLIVSLIAFLAFTANVNAQRSIQSFYEIYKDKDGVNDVTLKGFLLKMVAKYANEEEKPNVLERISHLRVLSMSNGNLVSKRDLKLLLNGIQRESYEPIAMVKDKGNNFELYIKEKEGMISNAVLVLNGKEDFILLSLEGLFRLDDLNGINFEVEGGEQLQKLVKQRKRA